MEGRQKMKVFINNQEITVFNGARVLDALRVYYMQQENRLPCKMPTVTDSYGNSIAPDGALTEGNHLYIRKLTTTE